MTRSVPRDYERPCAGCRNRAFTGDAETIAQTAVNVALPSTDRVYRLSSVLSAILRAYLPPRATQEWRLKCRNFVWPPVFATGWAAVAASTMVSPSGVVKTSCGSQWRRMLLRESAQCGP